MFCCFVLINLKDVIISSVLLSLWLQMKGLEESLVLRLLLLYEFGRGSVSAWASFIGQLAYCMNSPVCVL